MLLSEDKDNDFFVTTVGSGHWKLKVSLWVIRDTSPPAPKYAAAHKRKNLAETTILAVPVVILRKNGAIQYSQNLLHRHAHSLHCMKNSVCSGTPSPAATGPGVWEALRFLE